MPDHPCGGRAKQIVAQFRLVRPHDDAIRAFILGEVGDDATRMTRDEHRFGFGYITYALLQTLLCRAARAVQVRQGRKKGSKEGMNEVAQVTIPIDNVLIFSFVSTTTGITTTTTTTLPLPLLLPLLLLSSYHHHNNHHNHKNHYFLNHHHHYY